MTKLFLALIAGLLAVSGIAQTASWAHNLGFSHNHFISALASTSSGDAIVVINNRKATLSVNGAYMGDLFVQKKDSAGMLAWQKNFPATAVVLSVATDSLDNILLAGAYNGTLSLGSFTLTRPSVSSGVFIVKLDSAGNVVWASGDQTYTGTSLASRVTTGPSNDIYLTSVSGTVGSITRYTYTGTQIWNKTITNVRTFSSIVVDKNNEIYVSGTCFPSAVFDGISAFLPSTSYINFLAKLNAQQQTQWLIPHYYVTFDAIDGLVLNNNSLFWAHQMKPTSSAPQQLVLQKVEAASGAITASSTLTSSSLLMGKNISNRFIVTPGNDLVVALAAIDTARLIVLDSNLNLKAQVRFQSKSINAPYLAAIEDKLVFGANFSGASVQVNPYTVTNANTPITENDNFLSAIAFNALTTSGLPVTLLKFSGREAAGNILLEWSTANEIHNKGFEIQHSLSGVEWQALTFVNGAGKTDATTQYSYLDENVTAGIHYYRLKQIDVDGSYRYSAVLKVMRADGGEGLAVYPNPVRTSANIAIRVSRATPVQLAFINASGVRVKTVSSTSLAAGVHVLPVDLSALPAGYYTVKMTGGDSNSSVKIIKAE